MQKKEPERIPVMPLLVLSSSTGPSYRKGSNALERVEKKKTETKPGRANERCCALRSFPHSKDARDEVQLKPFEPLAIARDRMEDNARMDGFRKWNGLALD